jgi:hypothetical protein
LALLEQIVDRNGAVAVNVHRHNAAASYRDAPAANTFAKILWLGSRTPKGAANEQDFRSCAC